MGCGDKCLLTLAGQPLLTQVIDRFRPQVGAMMLKTGGCIRPLVCGRSICATICVRHCSRAHVR
ncbi:hypothetical protein [Thalassovita sp.]|uniref:hypothetical protein n=1 Tax=Thalassovita sp. TaxID=1979401 RepID=UPI003A5C846B